MCCIKFSKKEIKTERPAFVMGIVNATKDSFYAKSRGGMDLASKMIEQGVDILDLGAESTRPGFTEVPAEEEIRQLVPLVKEIRKISKVPISIDTRKASVFEACYNEGADIFNDVTALQFDEKSASLAAKLEVPVILMHQGPANAEQVKEFFNERIEFSLKNGIKKENIILDPGIGFGKDEDQCIELIKNTDKMLVEGFPFLMALSRKRCIGKMTGQEVDKRLTGTLIANLISIQKGADMVRVHDVEETIDMLNVMKFLS